jgi:hypothetical protein
VLSLPDVSGRREEESLSVGSPQGLVEGILAVLLVEADNGHASFGCAHLEHNAFSAARLIDKRDNFIALDETGLNEPECKRRTVPLPSC